MFVIKSEMRLETLLVPVGVNKCQFLSSIQNEIITLMNLTCLKGRAHLKDHIQAGAK